MRDFIYNKSDLLVALLIILIAGGLIYFRVGAIMDFPSANSGEKETTPIAQEQPKDDVGTSDAANGTQTTTGTDAEAAAGQKGTNSDDSLVKKDVTFVVNPGDATGVVATRLLEAGLIGSKQEFLNEVMAQNAETKIQVGTFTIPKGATTTDIVAILTR